MRRNIGRVRVAAIELVLFDPLDPLARRVGKINLWRLFRRRAADKQPCAALVHLGGVPITGLSQPLRLTRIEIIDRIDVAFEHAILVAGEEEPVIGVVYADWARHLPVAPSDRRPLAVRPTVEVMETAAFRAPDQAAVLQLPEV